jgi:hypothetical protein
MSAPLHQFLQQASFSSAIGTAGAYLVYGQYRTKWVGWHNARNQFRWARGAAGSISEEAGTVGSEQGKYGSCRI